MNEEKMIGHNTIILGSGIDVLSTESNYRKPKSLEYRTYFKHLTISGYFVELSVNLLIFVMSRLPILLIYFISLYDMLLLNRRKASQCKKVFLVFSIVICRSFHYRTQHYLRIL